MSPASELAAVLDREKRAAARANVDELLLLQTEKREVLARLNAAGVAPEELQPLVEAARGNITLIRQLVLCLRGVLGADAAVYGPAGEARPADVRPLRGRG